MLFDKFTGNDHRTHERLGFISSSPSLTLSLLAIAQDPHAAASKRTLSLPAPDELGSRFSPSPGSCDLTLPLQTRLQTPYNLYTPQIWHPHCHCTACRLHVYWPEGNQGSREGANSCTGKGRLERTGREIVGEGRGAECGRVDQVGRREKESKRLKTPAVDYGWRPAPLDWRKEPRGGELLELGIRTAAWAREESMSSRAPCGACKFLRRKCVRGCIFAPYFGSEQGPAWFAAVHKIFGASNVSKLLQDIPPPKRCDAVLTISYEAQARLSDPVYGCVSTIFALQQQVASLQAELAIVQSQLAHSRQLAAGLALHQQQQHAIFAAAATSSFENPLAGNLQSAASVSLSNPSLNTGLGFSRVKEEDDRIRGLHYELGIGPTSNFTHNMVGCQQIDSTQKDQNSADDQVEDAGELQAFAQALLH